IWNGEPLIELSRIMSPRIFLCLAILFSGIVAARTQIDPAVEYAAKFTGPELPEPPAQHRKWNAPTNDLPSNLISTISFLFDAGLADPRDCEYREYETVVGSVW